MLGYKDCIQGFNTFPCKVHLLNELEVMNHETDNLILRKSRGMDAGRFYSHLVLAPCQNMNHRCCSHGLMVSLNCTIVR